MNWTAEPPLRTVFRRAEFEEGPVDDRRLRKSLTGGEVTRISRGSFAITSEWVKLTPIAKHAQRVWEAAARMSPGKIFSRHAAAALSSIDLLGAWPDRIDVSGAGLGGSSGTIRRHQCDEDALVTVPWFDHFLTTPAQTAIDLAAALPFTQGVVAADQALWDRRPGGALATTQELADAASNYSGRSHARVTGSPRSPVPAPTAFASLRAAR